MNALRDRNIAHTRVRFAALLAFFTAVASAPAAAADCQLSGLHWRTTVGLNTLAAYQDHLDRFPDCPFVTLARLKIEALKAAVAVPATAPPPVAATAPPLLAPAAAAPPPAAAAATPPPAAAVAELPPATAVAASPPPAAVAASPPAVAVAAPPTVPPPASGPCAAATTVSLASRSPGLLSAAEECALKPRDTFRECPQCPEMVVVPAGTFNMGSPASERGRYVDEGPRHRVTFAQPFAVSRFAATFDEWDACLADGGCNGVRPGDNGWGRGRRPVIKVSWDDAKAYVAWLARKTGRPYRLLSEAEHEYATRAGTTTPFWTGSTISTKQANFNSQKSAPVDEYGPNPWGLYQLRGNVREWTEDCYRDGYKGAPTDGGPWSAAGCTKHVLRGGSWNFELATLLRSAARASYEDRDDDIGFRVARSLAPRAGAVASRGARLSRRGR